ncbi:MAG: quinolinate synthase [Thermoleophilaceae bacterium]|jgi:quinolinate synthase|nr:quinolinate synthase [Thermoleophilaceae bacterium]
MKPIDLPTLQPLAEPALDSEQIARLQDEVRALAEERNAVILAHNYQVPEVQDVAHFVGDSLALSRRAAATDADVIAFCGVHFMAETASILSPGKTVLLPDLDAGCSLADSITADQLREWKAQHPGAFVVMYVNTTAEVKAETDYCCTSSNAVQVVEHIRREHGDDVEILFGPDMWLGAYVERVTGRRMHVWDGECHVHAGIRPRDISAVRDAHPDAEFMIHPECGCTTQVMEYVAAGDVDPERTHMLSTGGMLDFARNSAADTFIVATETGMLHPLAKENPDKSFIPANRTAACRFMKMITLPKLHDALRNLSPSVKVDPELAERARIPIERMVAITP